MIKKTEQKADVLRRLKIAAGHLEKIINMVAEDRYCIDIMQQTAAVRSSIKKAEEILLSGHLNSCLVRAIRQDKEKQAIAELVEVFKRTA